MKNVYNILLAWASAIVVVNHTLQQPQNGGAWAFSARPTPASTSKKPTMTTTTDAPPVISLKSPSAVQDIADACSTWGGFVLVDHGLDPALMDQVLETSREFFALPFGVKNKYNLQLHGAKWRGYMPRGGERSAGGQQEDAKEGLYFGEESPPDHENIGLPTWGCNVFADDELPHMRSVFLKYHSEMKELGNRMMRLLSIGLGLDEKRIEKDVTESNPVILPRVFFYPPSEDLGIGKHSDYGLWTMNLVDAPGLEFQNPQSKEWVAVPFHEGSIVMNVGDVLDRLSAGTFVSPYHRARNLSPTEARISLPFFYDPSWDAAMKTLPIPGGTKRLATPERAERWSKTKIRCAFDGKVRYSEFLAKKVGKVFPDIIPEEQWKTLKSTSEPSSRHALVVESPDTIITNKVMERVKVFYHNHTEIKASHSFEHVKAVFEHSQKAVRAHSPPLSSTQSMQVLVASLLHDLDDPKYFPTHERYENSTQILSDVGLEGPSKATVLEMVSYCNCSQQKNSVPESVAAETAFWKLIPRWSDRLEAVGAAGVVRCYQYNREIGHPLSSENSPCPRTEEEVWKYARPERFQAYNGTSEDMISHYYDKLLHVARPPPNIVRNSYLEKAAQASSKELVEVCLRFGRTGIVDEEYIKSLAQTLKR